MPEADRGAVFLSEEEESDHALGGQWLLGTFGASWQDEHRERDRADGLSVDEALAWGRARSDHVTIRLAVGPMYWAGRGPAPADLPTWPPADLPDLVRRRPPELAYLDRRAGDAPIKWRVSLWVEPTWPADIRRGLPHVDIDRAEIVRIAEAAGAEWDDDALQQLQSDLQASASSGGGYISYGRNAYRLRVIVTAATHDEAVAHGAAKLTLPDHLWVESAYALPTDHPGHGNSMRS